MVPLGNSVGETLINSENLPDDYDPYTVLGVENNAAGEDIERAWNAISREYDPTDFDPGPDREEAERTRSAAEKAYEMLATSQGRARVDHLIRERSRLVQAELVSRAEVVEHCLCTGFRKQFLLFGKKRPRGRSREFSQAEFSQAVPRIYFWAHIALNGPVDVRLEWCEPGGTVYRYMEDTVVPVAGRFYFTAWIHAHRLGKKGLHGTWNVKFFAGGKELAGEEFVFKSEET